MRSITILVAVIIATCAVTASLVASERPKTRLEVDRKTGAILFLVNGLEQARLDGRGLVVRESVAYGGTIIDQGKGAYDDVVKVRATHAN